MILDNEGAEGRLNSPKNLVNKLNRIIAGPEPQKPSTNSGITPIVEQSVEPEIPKTTRDFQVTLRPTRERSMTNLSSVERTIAGVLFNKGEANLKQIGETFHITPGTVGRIAAGKVQDANNEAILKPREERINAIQDIAMEKLMASLGLIDGDKLANAKLTDLSRVAVDMSRIVEKTGPKDTNNGNPVVNLTLYCPTVKSEKEYKVVSVQS